MNAIVWTKLLRNMDSHSGLVGEKKIAYPSIDLMKLFLSFFVVGIHARSVTLVEYHPVIWYFCDFAVTYFFLVSGFFFRIKWLESVFEVKENLGDIKKYFLRILRLFLIWSLLYLPTEVYILANNNHTFLVDVGLFLNGFIVRGKVGYGITLWYLHSAVLGVGMIWFLAKRGVPFIAMFIFGLCLYVGGEFVNEYLQSDNLMGFEYRISQLLSGVFHRLFAGFFLFLVGAIMNVYMHKLTIDISLFIIALSIVLYAFDVPFSSLVSAIGFMSFTVSIPMIKMTWFYHFRNYSILIYLLHMFFIMLLSKGLGINSTIQIWLGAFILSALVACVILRLSNRIHLFKQLY